jgi:hypothetical protein
MSDRPAEYVTPRRAAATRRLIEEQQRIMGVEGEIRVDQPPFNPGSRSDRLRVEDPPE